MNQRDSILGKDQILLYSIAMIDLRIKVLCQHMIPFSIHCSFFYTVNDIIPFSIHCSFFYTVNDIIPFSIHCSFFYTVNDIIPFSIHCSFFYTVNDIGPDKRNIQKIIFVTFTPKLILSVLIGIASQR